MRSHKLLLFILLAAALFALTFSAYAANDPLTVYVSNAAGDDGNSGVSADAPVKTMSKAYDVLNGLMSDAGLANDPSAEGRILLTGNVAIKISNGPEPSTFTSHVYTVNVSGATPDIQLQIKNDYIHLGPTRYENITLKQLDNPSEKHSFFVANGYPLNIGENVTTLPSSNGYYFTIIGARRSGDYTGDTSVTVRSGIWRNIYAGAYRDNLTGNIELTVTGGTVTTSVASSYDGLQTGDLHVFITNAHINKLHGANSNGSVKTKGSTEITLADGTTVDGLVKCGGANGVTGDITLRLQNCTLNDDLTAVCSGKQTIEAAATEGGVLQLSKGLLHANTFTGGGTLVLSRESRLAADAVSGKTSLIITGMPYNKIAYVTAPSETPSDSFAYMPQDAESMVSDVAGDLRKWSVINASDPAGLFIKVPSGVSVTLYNDFKRSGAPVAPYEITTANGETVYAYYALPVGLYSYGCSGNGFFTVSHNLWYSEEKAASDLVIDADPGRKSGEGYESNANSAYYTQEVVDNLLPASPSLWPGYEEIFNIPCFTKPKSAHQMTTHKEMLAFLQELDGESDDMYVFIIGKSPYYKLDFPVVVFTKTDLSSASTLEEAAELVKANGKTTLNYRGMIHANEAAAGEAALSLIRTLDGAYGESVLESINVCVVPRVNPDGAYKYTRKNVSEVIDMNRDFMRIQSAEVSFVHHVYNLFAPEVTIDSHEFDGVMNKGTGVLDDVQIGISYNLNSLEEKNNIHFDVVEKCFENTRRLGLRAFYYDYDGKYTSSANYTTGREYCGLSGSISFLVETNGLYSGSAWYARRVMTQYAVAEAVIDYVCEHERDINALVKKNRLAIAEKGAVYDESDLLVLHHGISGERVYFPRPLWDLKNGTSLDPDALDYMYTKDTALRTRVRPTAYVIPNTDGVTAPVLSLLSKHAIRYYKIAAGSEVLLCQYSGNAEAAEVSAERSVTFEDGAYVIPMDQSCGNVIALLFEPDVLDTSGLNGSLVQSKLITPEADGSLPIYRYTHDLKNGRIKIENEHTHEFVNGVCAVCGGDSVLVLKSEGAFTLTGELENGTRVIMAGFDGDGRFVSVKEFVWQGEPQSADMPGCESVCAFFLSSDYTPLRKPVKDSVGLDGNDDISGVWKP